ncbi:MAG: hypothetical protein ACHQFW_03150, partial [Chitinophagales bacterium]
MPTSNSLSFLRNFNGVGLLFIVSIVSLPQLVMKRKIAFLHILFLLIASAAIEAQQYIYNYNVPVIQDGITLQFPFAGGLNNPQFSSVDINNDGVEDIYIFDRTGNKSLVLINDGGADEVNYFYWHQYQELFPPLKNWTILMDYNCDGFKDIITSFDSSLLETGIKTYKGSFDGFYSFTEDVNRLQFTEAGFDFHLPVGYIDIPGFADINFDGDIDVLTFNMAGGIVDYYENREIEDGLPCGTWKLEHINSCWGNFYESGITYSVDLDHECKGVNKMDDGMHAGSTFMIFDEDDDEDMDVVLGDLAFGNLNKLVNGGDKDFSHITDQDTTFPAYDNPYDVQIFPAAFLIDVNNDGKKDMLASPNNINQSENFKNVWYYKNISTDNTYVFDYQTDSLFVSDMIDLGDGAYPVFFDFNYDGLQDLIIGNYGYFNNGNYEGKLALYENTGSTTAPEFNLITRDLGGISAFNFISLVPAFGDMDDDGDEDLLLGESEGFLHYFKNIGPPDGPAQFVLDTPNYQGIDPGQNSAPQLIDINGDDLPDLIVGEKNGNLNYYENTGTAALPVFTLQSDFWGNVDVRRFGSLTGYSNPFLFKTNSGDYELYVGNEEGTIYL